MSLERALEENTAALREFTVYMKFAIEAASVVETPLPVIETSLPVIETPLPVIETPLPVIEAPVVKAKKPVAEAPPKVTAVVLPATETEVPHTLASVGLAMVTAAKLDRGRVVRILAEFGAVRVGDLSPADWDAFVEALK